MQEIWKDIPEWEGFYQASNLGGLKRLKRIVPNKLGYNSFLPEKILKQTLDPLGYYRVHLCVNHKGGNKKAHRLVASAFLDNPKNLPQVNHKDFNKSNNNINNLEWISDEDNRKHFVKSEYSEVHNSKSRGENNKTSKLKEIDIYLIRKFRNEYKFKLQTLANLFGVHLSQIGKIANFKAWEHIKENKEAI
jgi:hypothetical protein